MIKNFLLHFRVQFYGRKWSKNPKWIGPLAFADGVAGDLGNAFLARPSHGLNMLSLLLLMAFDGQEIVFPWQQE